MEHERTDKEVLSAIRMITGAKMMNRINPHRAELPEIAEMLAMPYEEVRESCLRLRKAGKIEARNTDGVRWAKAIQLAEELEMMNREI